MLADSNSEPIELLTSNSSLDGALLAGWLLAFKDSVVSLSFSGLLLLWLLLLWLLLWLFWSPLVL